MNPAISFAMWRFGVFPGAGVTPYMVAQLLGSVRGVVAACAVWGPVVAGSSIAYAVLQPGPGWSTISLFVAETLSMAVIVLLVGVSLAEPRLAPFVPWIVVGAIGMAIVMLGTSTGGSVNPACQIGTSSSPDRPASFGCISSHQWRARCSRRGSDKPSNATGLS